MRKAKRLALKRNWELSTNPTDEMRLLVKPSRQGLTDATRVRGKQKQRGSSKQPNGWPTVNSQFGY